MVNIQMVSCNPYDRVSISSINVTAVTAMTTQTIISLNEPKYNTINSAPIPVPIPVPGAIPIPIPVPIPAPVPVPASSGVSSAQKEASLPSIQTMTIPKLVNRIQKGQKVLLDPAYAAQKINVCLGWNVTNPQCDIDVSAFILGSDNKVLGDDWFVFYGQEYSPDKTVHFSLSDGTDREYISIDLPNLNPSVHKIVFVLTINDAFKNNFNFSMVQDAYMRILNADNQQELVSFQMTDYYSNVISMMIGEIYLHAGCWKCNAVGNGVAKDLAGLCALYGVQVI